MHGWDTCTRTARPLRPTLHAHAPASPRPSSAQRFSSCLLHQCIIASLICIAHAGQPNRHLLQAQGATVATVLFRLRAPDGLLPFDAPKQLEVRTTTYLCRPHPPSGLGSRAALPRRLSDPALPLPVRSQRRRARVCRPRLSAVHAQQLLCRPVVHGGTQPQHPAVRHLAAGGSPMDPTAPRCV